MVGVDVGGTFTDVFWVEEQTGRFGIGKVPSVKAEIAKGFLAGIESAVPDAAAIGSVVHGTTVGTNALLERKGAHTGIITTSGFRDVLEMRRRDRPQTWGLWGQFDPVVQRDMRVEVNERTLANGTIHKAIAPKEVKQAAKDLLDRGAQSVCIVFINAYANAENERQALEVVRSVWPNNYAEASSNILPEIREFERTSTTALNAYLQPLISSYLAKLENSFKVNGFEGQVLIVQSNGGVMTIDSAQRFPVRTALSGPAAGVIASTYIAGEAGFHNIVTCDMGGTSFDVSLVVEGESTLAAQTNIDFGMTVRTPMIEMTTIGAGGGSIAWVDRGGLLQVGPQSAGSNPGPVCYSQGNDRPTVTDANVVLGRINASKPMGDKLDCLDVNAAKAAIELQIGSVLGLDVMAAAEAIVRVANTRMAGAIRLVSIERGFDPKNFAAMPSGGCGALHAGALIKEVGLKSALIPRFPGINSALGCTIADMRHDFVQTVNSLLDDLDISELDWCISDLANKGLDLLDGAGASFKGIGYQFALDMSYLGQTHTLGVPLLLEFDGESTEISVVGIRDAFEGRYRQVYGSPLEGIPIRVLNLRVSALGHRPKFDLALLAPANGVLLEQAHVDTRPVWFDDAWHETPIYDRLPISVGVTVCGPAILEQPDATIFIEADLKGDVDRFGNLIITRKNED